MKDISLRITGIDCAACVARLDQMLGSLPGMERAGVNFAAGRADLCFDESRLTLAEIAQAVRRAGYGVPTETFALSSAISAPDRPDCAFGAISAQFCGVSGISASSARAQSDTQGSAVIAPALFSALSGIFGVIELHLAAEEGVLLVSCWPIGLDSRMLLRTAKEAGFELTLASVRGGDEELENTARLSLLRRIAVSVFLTMPLMWELAPRVQFVFATLILLGPGMYFFRGAVRSVRNKSLTMDFLIAFSTSVIYAYSTYTAFTETNNVKLYFLAQGVLTSLILFGKYVELIAKGEASGAIRKLLRLQPATALVEREGREAEIPVEDIVEHDVIVLRPGERVPVDGLVLEGSCSVDESMLTGESLPVDKKPGEYVIGGTLNRAGSVRFAAARLGKDSVLQQIVETVRRAQSSKAPIQRFADRIASWFVPAVIGIAALVFCVWYWPVTHGDLETSLLTMSGVLVIACPCALGLATPTGIMVGSGRAAELGILFRGGEQLENAWKVTDVIFDKTGTLTYGTPEVTDVQPVTGSPRELFLLAASVERLSEHPVAGAVTRSAAHLFPDALPPTVGAFRSLPGLGVGGTVSGSRVLCGSRAMLADEGVDLAPLAALPDLRESAKTEVCVARDGVLLGVLGVSDPVRPEAAKAVARLRTMGLRVWMLTGDNRRTAEAVGALAGISDTLAEVRPLEKAAAVEKLRAEGRVVAMVGDGVNDAPALVAADLGVAMGNGTDVAIDAADAMLLGGRVDAVPTALRLSRETMRVIRENLRWALCYNLVCIPVAACGLVNPVIASAAMSLSSIIVLMHSLRLKKACPQAD